MRKIIAALVLATLIGPGSLLGAPAKVTYILDASQSKFMAHANAGGLLWFKGHNHHLAASEFTGQVELTPESVTPASLRLVVRQLRYTKRALTSPNRKNRSSTKNSPRSCCIPINTQTLLFKARTSRQSRRQQDATK